MGGMGNYFGKRNGLKASNKTNLRRSAVKKREKIVKEKFKRDMEWSIICQKYRSGSLSSQEFENLKRKYGYI